jgi:hypothetical protein
MRYKIQHLTSRRPIGGSSHSRKKSVCVLDLAMKLLMKLLV